MAENSDVYVDAIGWLNFGLLLFRYVKVIFLHFGPL